MSNLKLYNRKHLTKFNHVEVERLRSLLTVLLSSANYPRKMVMDQSVCCFLNACIFTRHKPVTKNFEFSFGNKWNERIGVKNLQNFQIYEVTNIRDWPLKRVVVQPPYIKEAVRLWYEVTSNHHYWHCSAALTTQSIHPCY